MSIYRRRAGKIMHHDTAKAEVGLLAFSVLMVMVGGIRCLRLGLSVSISAHNLPRADHSDGGCRPRGMRLRPEEVQCVLEQVKLSVRVMSERSAATL